MAKVGDIDIEDKVFEVTKELLLKYGVKGWNMNNLSEECGMSKRTLYKIIKNKEELLYKCSLSNINRQISKLEKFFNSDQSYDYLLDNLSTVVIDLIAEFIIRNEDSLRKEYPRIREMIDQRLVCFNKLYIDFFLKGQKLGCLDESLNPQLINELLDGIVEHNIINCRSKEEFQLNLHFAIKVLIRGIRK